jgi:hypothetical protein
MEEGARFGSRDIEIKASDPADEILGHRTKRKKPGRSIGRILKIGVR